MRITTFFVFLYCGGPLFAADVVRFLDEGARNQSGRIVEMSPAFVKFQRGTSGNTTEIPANTISSVQFDQEPPPLTVLRTAMIASRYADALETAEKLDPNSIRNSHARADYDFYRALAHAKLAFAERSADRKTQLQKAAELCTGFLRDHPQNYHFFEACELLGELHNTAGNPEKALQAYSSLAKAPWLDMQLKAHYHLGALRLGENRLEDSEKHFQTVLRESGGDPQFTNWKNAAEVGLAKCMVQKGREKEAIEILQTLLLHVEAEDIRTQADVYCALGGAYEKLDRPREAILAYLHVEILFPSAKEEYRIALERLSRLWKTVQRPERAAETERLLREIR